MEAPENHEHGTANPRRTTVEQGDKHDQDWPEVAEDVREAAAGDGDDKQDER